MRKQVTGATDKEIAAAGGVYVGIHEDLRVRTTCPQCGATCEADVKTEHRVLGRIASIDVLKAIVDVLGDLDQNDLGTMESVNTVRAWLSAEDIPS